MENKNFGNLNLKEVFYYVKKNWYLFGVFVLGFLGVAHFINSQAPRKYEDGSTILIHSDKTNTQKTDQSDFLQGFQLLDVVQDFNNELSVLQSSPLIRSTVNDKELYISYYEKSGIWPTEVYNSSPYKVVINESKPQAVEIKYSIKFINETQFLLNIDDEDVKIYEYSEDRDITRKNELVFSNTYHVSREIQTEHFSFKILLNSNFNFNTVRNKDYYFVLKPIYRVVGDIKKNLVVEPLMLESTVASITYEGSHFNKAIDIVSGITSKYIQRNIEKKDYIAVNTIEYIDRQINAITDSLTITEQELQRFRKSNQVLDIGEKANRVFQQLQGLEDQRATLESNFKYYQQLKKYFEDNQDSTKLIAPSSMGITDPVLNNLIQELTLANNEKQNLIKNKQERNPYLQTLNIKIQNLKNTIAENINYSIRSSRVQIQDIDDRIMKLTYEVNKLPQTQRQLVGIERQFNVSDAVYTFLLQKRAEAHIARASNLPDAEIIEPASYMSQSFPNKKLNYLLALFLGIAIPGGIVYIKVIGRDKIGSIEEVEKISQAQVIGIIPHHSKKELLVFIKYPKTYISESFRSIRTFLKIPEGNRVNRTILVTSGIVKDGKSFTAINLASSFAMEKRKTVLLGFDLRKPSTIFRELGTSNLLGISAYLTNESSIDDIVTKTKIEHLDFISAGELLPNPAELISGQKTNDLFSELKKIYEYIIIDSPPLSPVTDSYILMNYADYILYITRQLYTPKENIKQNMTQLSRLNKFNKMGIILNDYKEGTTGSYKSYSSHYSYGPTDGSDQAKSSITRIFHKVKEPVE